MTRLFDKETLRRIGHLWRTKLAANTNLLKQAKLRAKSGPRWFEINWFWLLVPALSCGGLYAARASGWSVEIQLAWVTTLLVAIQLRLASGLATKLYASQDLAVLFMAPVADRDIFLWEFRKWIWMLWPYMNWILALFALFFWGVGGSLNSVWMALPVAAATMCFILPAAIFLNLWQPIPIQFTSGIVTSGTFVIFFMGRFLEIPSLMKIFETIAYGVNRLVPFGWLGMTGTSLLNDPASLWWLVLAIVAFPALGYPALKRRLMNGYKLNSDEIDPDDPEDDIESAGHSDSDHQIKPRRRALTERTDQVRSGEIFQLPEFITKGLLDRMFVSWLTPRECWLAKMLFFDDHVGLSGRLRYGAIGILIASIVWWFAVQFDIKSLWFVGGIVTLIGLFPLFPFTSKLDALPTAMSGDASISAAAILPATSGELIKLDLKYISLQTLTNIPIILWLGIYLNWLLNTNHTGQTLAYSFAGLWSILASRPIASAWAIANGTTRPSGRLARRFALSSMKGFTLFLYVILMIAMAVLLNYSIAGTIAVGMLQWGLSLGYAAWFVRVYNRGWLSAERYGVFDAEL